MSTNSNEVVEGKRKRITPGLKDAVLKQANADYKTFGKVKQLTHDNFISLRVAYYLGLIDAAHTLQQYPLIFKHLK